MRLAARTPAVVLVAVLVAAVVSAPAAAHTGLDASDPADGATVDGPLELVVLDFTGTPTAIDDGIAVADATGATIVPAEVTQDGLRIVARFAPPLPAGSYALSWIVRSDDTHTIDGSFAFAVNVPTTTTVAPTTVPPTTAAPTTVAEAAPVVASTVAPTTSEPPTSAADAAEAEADRSVDVVVAPIPPASSVASEVDEGEAVARIGRLLLFPATVVAIGVLAFAAFAFAGRRDELGSLLRVVRWLGVAIALGALLEVVGLRSVFGGYGDLLDSGAGRAATARIAAGVLLVVGLGAVGAPARSLSAAVVDDIDARPSDQAASDRWRPTARDAGGLVGVVLLVVSFAFDGHTASEGPRLVHAFASMAHVAAASVWAGGLVALSAVLWLRHRAGVTTRALEMVARFSVGAMISLAVAGLAGLVMAWFIESDIGSYWSTDWGRLMLLKLLLVLIALALGAYNHFRMLPGLDAAPGDPAVVDRARAVVTAEAVVLIGAALVTAMLVGASTI